MSGQITLETRHDAPTISLQIWNAIEKTRNGSDRLEYRAYLLWLRWLDALPELCPPNSVLGSLDYWQLIRGGLNISERATQKVCLHIFRKSVALLQCEVRTEVFNFEPAQKRQYVAAYELYFDLYETIVIGRYINQVEECLAALPSLLPSGRAGEHRGFIHYAWLITLLTAALQDTINYQTRNAVGKWIMPRNNPPPHGIISTRITCLDQPYRTLLFTALLPWALQGSLLLKSSTKSGRNVKCLQGLAVVSFFDHFWDQCADIPALKQLYFDACMQWLSENSSRINVHAAWYMARSMRRAPGSEPCTPHIARLALSICQQSHRSTVQQLHMATECRRLCESSTEEESIARSVARLAADLQPPQRSEEFGTLISAINEDWHVLRGNKLLPTCKSLVFALENLGDNKVETSAEEVLKAIQVLWSECEFQEYLRPFIILIPRIAFHPHIIDLATSQEARNLIATILDTLNLFAGGRIYVWNPLAFAVRNAFRHLYSGEDAGHDKTGQLVGMIQPGSPQDSPPTNDDAFLDIEAFVIRFVNSPPTPKSEFLLDMAVELQVNAGEVNEDAMLRHCLSDQSLGHACIFDMLNRPGFMTSKQAKSLLSLLMSPWLAQQEHAQSAGKWKRTAQLQGQVLLVEKISKEEQDVSSLQEMRSQFFRLLKIEHTPRFRFLFEWIIVTLTYRMMELKPDTNSTCQILAALDTARSQQDPRYLCSLLRLAVMVVINPSTTQDYGVRLFQYLVTLAASPKAVVRHEAQWNIPIAWRMAVDRDWATIMSNEILVSLHKSIIGMDKYRNTPAERVLTSFNPLTEKTLTTLFQGRYLEIEPPEAALLTADDFLEIWRRDGMSTEEVEPSLALSLGPGRSPREDSETPTAPTEIPSSASLRARRSTLICLFPGFQTKSRGSKQSSTLADEIGAVYKNNEVSNTRAQEETPRAVLIAFAHRLPYQFGWSLSCVRGLRG